MSLQRLWRFLSVLDIFLDLSQVVKSPTSFWELPKCPKYFSMHLQILQDLFKVLNHFLECLQAVKRPPREKKRKKCFVPFEKRKKIHMPLPGIEPGPLA